MAKRIRKGEKESYDYDVATRLYITPTEEHKDFAIRRWMDQRVQLV